MITYVQRDGSDLYNIPSGVLSVMRQGHEEETETLGRNKFSKAMRMGPEE